MPAILAITVPFFALVLCGFLAAHWRALPQSAIPGLNSFVLYFALPCMLFRFGAATPLADLLEPALLAVYGVCALAMIAVTVAATLSRSAGDGGVDLTNAAFGALVAAFPNTGFMGVPLLVALFGERAIGPMVATLLVDLIVSSTLCIALAQLHGQLAAGGAQGVPLRAALGRSLRGALRNPLPWAIAVGAVFSYGGWALPGVADAIVKMLADAATPVALFTIGAVLWRARQHAHTRTPPAQFVPLAFAKLFVHPLLVLATGLLASGAGLAVPGFGLTVLVLAAALPSASNVSLLAERFGADNGRVARIIMTSTAAAFVSFPAIAWLLGAGGAG